MDNVNSLSSLIDSKLSPFFDGNECVLLDAPYHENVGDILIYQGELSFLQKNDVQIKSVHSYNTFNFDAEINEDTIIAIHGGGNMGDIYPEHMQFLKKVSNQYPNNKIIVFPQTIFYKDMGKAKSDFEELKKHSKLIFCSRDTCGFELLKKYFGEKHSLLLPDMAFCIDPLTLIRKVCKNTKKALYIQRKDIEKSIDFQIGKEVRLISDWPSFQYSIRKESLIAKILNNLYDKIANRKVRKIIGFVWDRYFNVHRKLMIKEGVDFISPFDIVHTTRLHGAILAVLLGKEVHLYNNSYGKNKTFYDSWLVHIPNVWMDN